MSKYESYTKAELVDALENHVCNGPECESCAFENPKCSATAAIIRDNQVLLLKRAEEPFKGKWDFLGGYLDKGETPEQAMVREIQEELGVEKFKIDFVRTFPGTAEWKGKQFPILSHLYIVELIGEEEIKLNDENEEYIWVNIKDLNTPAIAFDSNQVISEYLKKHFVFDLSRVKELMAQLDESAVIQEFSLYRAMLNGFVSQKYDEGKLVGMGWIFPRRTALRSQAVVEDMIVDSSQRGKGLGREILQDLLRWAKDNGMDMVELTTNAKREAANGLYKSEGFWLHETNHYLYNVE
jgi:mutator protein MutT